MRLTGDLDIDSDDEELRFHHENNDPINLYEALVRIYYEKTGNQFQEDTKNMLKTSVLDCFGINSTDYLCQEKLDALIVTLDGLINPSHR